MGTAQLQDGSTGNDKANPTVADRDAPPGDLLLTGPLLCRAVVATVLLTIAAAPFLKGLLAGFALAGAAAAVRDVLGV